MDFFVIYLIIPTFLFLACPKKKNYPLLIYWAFITIFSYDNVTDFWFYYNEFTSLAGNDLPSYYYDKGREWGWVLLMKLFTFTEYGIVIIHMLVMAFIVYQYHKYSRKVGLLNTSVWLYFICNLTWKHDNILRQDIAMGLAYIAFFMLIQTEKIDKKLIMKLSSITFVAFLFHISAILIIPLFLLIRWVMQRQFRFNTVFILVAGITLIFFVSGVNNILNLGVLFFSSFSSSRMAYYANNLGQMESEMTRFSLVWSLISTVPLFYYTFINNKPYRENPFLRLCVNMSWIVVTWRTCFVADLLRRPTDYLLWFQVWGYAYFIRDAFTRASKSVTAHIVGVVFVTILAIQEYRFINSYYGDNNYMTVFTEECSQMRLYKRNLTGDEDLFYKRIR